MKFNIDGNIHNTPVEECTEGCTTFGTDCPKCSRKRHYQPVYGGYVELCDDCDKKEIDGREV